MRRRAPWMTVSDDKILEFLSESGAAHNLKGIVLNCEDRDIEISYQTVKRRCPALSEAKLLETLDAKGLYYKITPLGEQYLAEQVDLSDVPEPEAGGH